METGGKEKDGTAQDHTNLCYGSRSRQALAIVNAGAQIWYLYITDTARKITVEVPPDLLEKAQQATGSGVTQTVRTGLQLVAASQAYARLRQLRGKVRFTRTLAELKTDR